MTEPVIIPKMQRSYVADNFTFSSWADLQPFFDELLNREIASVEELEMWMLDCSELERIVEEDYCWRYISKTRDTENEEYDSDYNFFVEEIQPHLMQVGNKLNHKLVQSPFVSELDQDRYFIHLRSVRNQIELFREENIPLLTELEKRSKEYYVVTGKMTVEIEGKELTLQQAAKFQEDKDRAKRKMAFEKEFTRRLEDSDALNEMFDDLLRLRHQVALNAGFDNYRDYKLKSLGRFDYGVKECEQFHDAVEHELVPLVNELHQNRKERLGLDVLRPYDSKVDFAEDPLPNPFNGIEDLIQRSVACLERVDPYFAGCLQRMSDMGHLDLDSRKGKAPGGYNCGLAETGVPFIFMNAANTGADVSTMIHEGGHAVHSFLMHDLKYKFDREINSEEAELASMSMELFALEHYEAFYPDAEQRKRAIYLTLETTIVLIPWIALIDKFQHWLYTNPGHSVEERYDTWMAFHKRFSSSIMDWSGYDDVRRNFWQRQLHLFKIPFYYIEYGIAQLGAIGMWRNYLKDEHQALSGYKNALALGAMRSLPEMYETAGVPFDFSREYIRELSEFVRSKMN